jgi:hypothetical protein
MDTGTQASPSASDEVQGWDLGEDYLSDPAVAPLRSLVSAAARRAERHRMPPTLRVRPVCPLWSWVFDAAAISPYAVGVAFAFALASAFALLDVLDGNYANLAAGEVPLWAHVEFRSMLVVAVLLAGILVTHRYEELGIRQDVVRLAPQLQPPNQVALLERQVGHVPRRGLYVAGGLGALLIASLVPALYLDPTRFLSLETYAMPSVLLDLVIGAVIGWTLFRTLYAGIAQDRAFARLSGQVATIDLLDLSPLRPFARRGQRRALRWLLLATVAAFVFVDAGFATPPALVFVAIMGFAMFSFLLPVYGIHRNIHAEKQLLLATLRDQIRAERGRLGTRVARLSGAAAGGGGHLADLLAYEARISGAREWPVDTTILLRLALILLLPLASWLGGAFVERAVDAALG